MNKRITVPADRSDSEVLTAPVTEHVDLAIEGMTCASCVARVERSILKLAGVDDVVVNLATKRARITVRPEVSLAQLREQVERAGYSAAPVLASYENQETADHVRDYRIRFYSALPLAVVILLMSMVPMTIPQLREWAMGHMFAINVIQFALATLFMVISGRSFFVLAGRSARHGVADMNTLIVVGTGAAYLFSSVVTFFHQSLPGIDVHDVYYDVSAIVITLVLLGRWLEARATSDASEAIRNLMRLAPRTAHRVADGDHNMVEDVEVEFIKRGDLLLVKPGESVPVDGTVIEGFSTVDESMMTGESIPIEKVPGLNVIGGTINTTGSFVMRAEGVGEETVLAQIIRTVEDAQSSRAPVQRLADRIASVFVPVVIVLAIGTLFGWMVFADSTPTALIHAVAVLVIACPCAMGLAVPTAIIAGTGRGAERGILIQNAESLERAGETGVVVFDKTGTLTYGRPEVVSVTAFSGFDQHDVLRLAASVEAHSEHPIAQSIVRHMQNTGNMVSAVQEFVAAPGIGAYGKVEGHQLFIGRKSNVMGTDAVTYQEPVGTSAVWVEIDGVAAGVIAVADTLKSHAVETVIRLKKMGIEVVMLTGDSRAVAEEVALSLGIEQVIAEVLPHEKGSAIQRLKKRGRPVAMVGDGINDAPALAFADVGIAMATGTDVAMSIADITLIGGDISRVPEAISLSRRTMRVIRQNLFWAFIYNVVGIPLAAFGLLSPIFAGAAMAMSSVSVVSNSLRLRR